MSFYAVNLADLANTPPSQDIGVQLLLAPVISKKTPPVEVEKRRFDGIGVVLTCDEERASAIVEILRQKYKKYELRLYTSKTGAGGWKRV